VDSGKVPLYIIPFAFGNFLGPLLLGRLYDVVGRKPMIAGSYIVSGVLLLVTAFLFKAGTLTATTQTIAWCVIFFFASAGASSAYLTVSEIFPMETRAMAIAFFYAIGTAVGGITGPLLFGKLIGTGKTTPVFWGFVLGAVVMMIGGVVQAIWGVKAEQRSLEDIATPLTAQDAEESGEREEPARASTGRFTRSSQAMWSPSQQSSMRGETDSDLDDEVDALVAALHEHGPQSRRELGRLAGCRHWGPGRFGRALRVAVLEGRARRVGRDRFEAVDYSRTTR
jgi:MFS family permease